METIAKKHYREYVASNEILRPHYFLADTILGFNPEYVFEFGCGSGKNLRLLLNQKPGLKAFGLDISSKNIENCKNINKLDSCSLGDESELYAIHNNAYDVVFTCSVLDHIQEIASIIDNFQRIASKAVILFETNDLIEKFYYAHNYESFGFRKLNYSYISNEAHDGDGAKYEIWLYQKV